MTARGVLGRIAYGAMFCVVVPLLLVLWARSTSGLISLPAYGTPWLGAGLAILGLLLMMGGMRALWVRGGGLPMNAYPPDRYVSSGLYALIPHPIYAGFSLMCFGASMTAESASGLWLVSPCVVLGCIAIVLGYEQPDMKRRFDLDGDLVCRWLPLDEARSPRGLDHLRYVLFLLLPWMALYQITACMGVAADAVDLSLPVERSWPVMEWAEPFYASTYLVVSMGSFLAVDRAALRRLMIRSWVAILVAFPIFLTVPVTIPRKPFVPASLLGQLLEWERDMYLPVAAFPSFHVIWSILIAEAVGVCNSPIRWLMRVWAAAVAVTCVATGMHSIADVAAGVVVAAGVLKLDAVRKAALRLFERIANSWREWRVGPVRVINHGFYAGLGAFAAALIVSTLIGAGGDTAVLLTMAGALAGAALWAQWVEGSPALLRPFGFYGGLIGVALTSCLGFALGWSPWLLIAAYCVASPVMQSIGRLRCLVQGCCHGRPTESGDGIHYRHARSRVVRLANLGGVAIHPTPVYSMLWNMLCFPVLLRLWITGQPLHLIAGVFALLTGFGRFVEEDYRGEPQTPVFAGLRLYQWIAVGMVAVGALITAAGESAKAPAVSFDGSSIAVAAVAFVVCGAAMGVDFPESARRFARLT